MDGPQSETKGYYLIDPPPLALLVGFTTGPGAPEGEHLRALEAARSWADENRDAEGYLIACEDGQSQGGWCFLVRDGEARSALWPHCQPFAWMQRDAESVEHYAGLFIDARNEATLLRRALKRLGGPSAIREALSQPLRKRKE